MELDPRFLTTEYVVEATDTEKFFLWQKHHEKVDWEQGTSGIVLNIGELGGERQQKRPINITCYWDRINGMNVLFWTPVSQLVDHKMISDWFDKNAYYTEAKSGRAARCDAMNFNHCIDYSKEERPPVNYSDRRMQILSDYSVTDCGDFGEHTHTPEYCHKAYKEVKKRIDDSTAYGQYYGLDECFTMLCDWLEMDNPPHHLVTEMKAKLWRAFYDNPPKISLNTIEVLEKLKRKGITLSIGSNTNFIPGIVLRNAVLDKLDLFDYMVFSDEVGVSKPRSKFFQIINKKCWDVFGHCGDSIVHIGDSEVFDVTPATQFGINAALVSDPFALPAILENYL